MIKRDLSYLNRQEPIEGRLPSGDVMFTLQPIRSICVTLLDLAKDDPEKMTLVEKTLRELEKELRAMAENQGTQAHILMQTIATRLNAIANVLKREAKQ